MRYRVFAVLALAAAIVGRPAAQSYVPHRVFDAARGSFTDFEAMAAQLAKADVVFVGEQHDDPNTHRLELATLEALLRRVPRIVLSLEMFERDVQEPLDHFSMGHLSEEEFLKSARPWPRYATDYKPLVDLAIAHEWPIVAANVPRAIASEISKGGLDVLKGKSDADRKLFASDLRCPTGDDYFKRFGEAMGSHPAPDATADDARRSLERYYFAQCVKDETMAESIAQSVIAARGGTGHAVLVHVNGAFHSDFGQGTVERLRRRLPEVKIAILTVKPVQNLDEVEVSGEERRSADFVVYTLKK